MEALHLVEVVRWNEYTITFLKRNIMFDCACEQRVLHQVRHEEVDRAHVDLVEWVNIRISVKRIADLPCVDLLLVDVRHEDELRLANHGAEELLLPQVHRLLREMSALVEKEALDVGNVVVERRHCDLLQEFVSNFFLSQHLEGYGALTGLMQLQEVRVRRDLLEICAKTVRPDRGLR